MAIVEFKNVSRLYTSGDHELKAIDDVSMELDEGKFVVILGPSGAGKSTLLNLLGGLDSPTSGKIYVEGKDISTLSNDRLAEYRAETVGFVFQFYNLVPTLTVHENVFNPPPKVKSAVIRMTRNETMDLGCNEKLFKQIVKATFNQRRKTLRNSISTILDKTNPLSMDPIFNKRPEQLSVKEFIDLTNRVEEALKQQEQEKLKE